MTGKLDRFIFLIVFALLLGCGMGVRTAALDVVTSERALRDAVAGNHETAIEIGGTVVLNAPLVIKENKKITIRRGSLSWSEHADERLENMIIVENNAVLTLENVSVNGKDAVGLVYVDNGGKLVLEKGSTLRRGKAETAGGIYNKGTVILNGGTITECTAVNGGGIYNYGMFTMSSGTVIENVATKTGGGLYNLGTFIMEGGRFADNEAETGRGVYQHKDAKRFEVANYPAIADGIYLAKKQTIVMSLEDLERSSSLMLEGVEDAAYGRTVVTGVRERMHDQIVVGFGIAKGYPWKLFRYGNTYAMAPDEDRPAA